MTHGWHPHQGSK